MKRLASLAMALAAVVQTASPATAATRYYSRQYLASLKSSPTYAYTPTYGAFGVCSGGTQSASITTCTRNDGVVVDNAQCTPQTISQPCTSYTYAATYGAYGACNGSTQTASITKCTRSDGTVVANSACSPQTKSQACSITVACGSFAPSTCAGGSETSIGTAATAAAATAMCQSYAQSQGSTSGSCQWTNYAGDYGVVYGTGAVRNICGSAVYGSTCAGH